VMHKWGNMKQSHVVWRILKRTALIFLLGYLMYWFPFFGLDKNHDIVASSIRNTRIMGVLQRIALCYGISALMIYFLKIRASVIISIVLLFYIGYYCIGLVMQQIHWVYRVTWVLSWINGLWGKITCIMGKVWHLSRKDG